MFKEDDCPYEISGKSKTSVDRSPLDEYLASLQLDRKLARANSDTDIPESHESRGQMILALVE